MHHKSHFTKLSVYFTFFVDNLSWSIVFPIFAPLFIDPDNKIFSADVSVEVRTVVLGFFLMAFPLAQFFGAPLIGEYADKTGRRRALLFTIFFTLIGLFLSGYAITYKYLSLLFISRLITGAFSGNLSVCLAAIADISESDTHKVKNFGYLSIVAGLSFIIGAYVGGKFSDSQIHPMFNAAFPFWIAGALTLLNFLFVYFGFQETGVIQKNKKFHVFKGVENIRKALRIKNIKRVYLIYLFIIFSWTLMFQFTPVYLIDLYHFSNSQIGDIAAYMGICWAIGSSVVHQLKKMTRFKLLEFSLIAFAVFCILITHTNTVFSFLLVLGFCVLFAGITWPLCTGIISSRADKQMQGKILGMSQSMQSLAMAFSPIVGGVADFFSINLFFWISSLSCFLALIIYLKTNV